MISQLTQFLNALEIPADWIGLRATKESSTTRSVRDRVPETNGSSLTQGVMVEVLVKGQIGYAATNLLTVEGIQAAAAQAYRQALAASAWNIYSTSIEARPKVVGQYVSPLLKPFDALSPGEINQILTKITEELKISDQIVQTSATALTTETETWFVSTNGSEVYQHFFRIGTDYAATAQEGSVVQRRTNNGWLAACYQGGLEYFITPELWQRVQQVGEQAIELLNAEDCPSETTTLVLAPDQMLLQIHESVGHPLELDRILGDERNYAGGSFVKLQDFGNLVYGSPLMNITFDPTVSGEFASYSFDDTGAPATREYLIKDGILQRGVGSLESQARTGVKGVACARASSWNRPPIDRMANLNLEPGTKSFEEIIAGIDRGIYMESNRSWSIDDQRHKFQFSCEYAKRIEQGKLTTTLRNPNYRSITPQFWGGLVEVGDRSTWQMYGTPMCGKGEPNQAITVGHGSPVAVFANIEVFGGGA
ncbi:C69 family peptidase [Leptolyngbya boryana NIES-2135]|jgi:predicted Zn-dependent protease|uniref:C69 family peptidase n=1 Tax=Leptolyngbya boryana NIES-2135 TaxID=1973484 RepID=A0A1Z4JKB5_LEPBY|nr:MULTISPECIES: TldD/PmbA family protein [Leptolyngbya]BAY57189.1 C69 family peptidase [Leptolyngbya boryana NIES-2135]MBD2367061.1 TldD/PmbA family protein [Leptolyngbya sp. FACHB-161]MBD2373586.1 TldD/PmbA family protein [Leptolyngbya sp. FACHB-238]MBD2397994.1 TldD/PmbA family protein [Leptolyngbya sp. FACHB-239]MBD2404496.1 TldD/PmbA family protein [Leptolyngbya sp. FACHB-402]